MTTYRRAREVEEIVAKYLTAEHKDLNRADVTIRCVFRDTVAKSNGRIVLGKARKVSGLAAFLAGPTSLTAKLAAGTTAQVDVDDQPDFFVIEIPEEPWRTLTDAQKHALIDHELCHFGVEDPDDEDKPRKLIIRGHDVEDFIAVVERHGLWRGSVREFVNTANAQLELELSDAT